MPTMEEISKQIREAGMMASQQPENNLPGGEGDNLTPTDVDAEQLAKGIAVEMEHTGDEAVAKEIALDHLAEDPKYYDKLEEMEKDGVDKKLFSKFAATRLASPAQKAALQKIKEREKLLGNRWRDVVEAAWQSGKYPDYLTPDEKSALQALRNEEGASALR